MSCFMFLLCFVGDPLQTRFLPVAADGQEAQTFEARMRFQLRNESDRPAREITFYVYVPCLQTPWQSCLELTCSSPAWLRQDTLGNAYLVVPIAEIAPFASKFVGITARMAWRAQSWNTQVLPGQWLAPEPFIQVTDARIQALARELKGDSANATALAIYSWIRTHVKDSGYEGPDRGALFVLSQGHGDCTEMAYLFTALARAAGLPTRFFSGYPLQGDAVLAPQRYHNWACYHDGQFWHLADPQAGRFGKMEEFYLQFTTSGPRDKIGPPTEAHRFSVDHPAIQTKMLSY